MPAPETKAAEEAYKEGQKQAKATTALAATQRENETLKKATRALERGYMEATSQPNLTQLGVGLGTAVGASFLGYKANELLEAKTAEWVDPDTGEKTLAGKIVQHGVTPVVGLAVAVLGAFAKNGTISAATMGSGVGLMAGSMLRSVMTPAPAP